MKDLEKACILSLGRDDHEGSRHEANSDGSAGADDGRSRDSATAGGGQDALGGALLGGAAGAIIGGAASGRAGGAVAGGIIGAAAGAAIGASMEQRRAGYYWYRDGCWLKRRDGSYVRVHRRNCY